MRATILCVVFLLCHLSAQGEVFVFKSGKSIQGDIRYQNDSIILIRESSGLDMTLRKNEIDFAATAAANKPSAKVAAGIEAPVEQESKRKSPQKIYTNRDLRAGVATFTPPQPETDRTWEKSLAKLEREFVRLQGACRGAGTGPNLSKVMRSHTYRVNGKQVRVTGYWADPANIEEAKQICNRAIDAEEILQQARRAFQDFLKRQKNQSHSLTGQ
jgi:hypothetical protein